MKSQEERIQEEAPPLAFLSAPPLDPWKLWTQKARFLIDSAEAQIMRAGPRRKRRLRNKILRLQASCEPLRVVLYACGDLSLASLATAGLREEASRLEAVYKGEFFESSREGVSSSRRPMLWAALDYAAACGASLLLRDWLAVSDRPAQRRRFRDSAARRGVALLFSRPWAHLVRS